MSCSSLLRTDTQTSEESPCLNHEEHIPLIDCRELVFVKHIAAGGMAEISLYKWNRPENTQMEVAKKSLFKGSLSGRYADNLKKEMGILMHLDHDNVVRTFGAVETGHDFGLVMEYFPFGSYRNFFSELRHDIGENVANLEEVLAPVKIEIIDEIIDAMRYLHGIKPKRVLHLDLKSDNVLLENRLHAKLCDFGLSRMSTLTMIRNRTALETVNAAGTPGYIAPERLQNVKENPTTKSDVYSFAILKWEILSDRMAYEELNLNLPLLTHYIANQNGRPEIESIPSVFPEELISMMQLAWNSDPNERPSFEELKNEMTSIKQSRPEFEQGAETSRQKTLELWESHCQQTPDSLIGGATHSHAAAQSTPSRVQSITVPKRIHGPSESQIPAPQGVREEGEGNESTLSLPDYNECESGTDEGSEKILLIPRENLVVKGNDRLSVKNILIIMLVMLVLVGGGLVFWRTKTTSHHANACPTLQSPLHGHVTCSSGMECTKNCTYSCDDGYAIKGDKFIVCTSGKWNGKTPTCEPTCPAIAQVANGEFHCTDGYLLNSVCVFSCINRHQIQGNDTLTCRPDAKWSSPEPSCVCPLCFVGDMCKYAIKWSVVDQALDGASPNEAIRVKYGENEFTCTTEMHSLHFDWSGICTDAASGQTMKCSAYLSPGGAMKHAAAQLIRAMASEKEYLLPCDAMSMPTKC